MKIINDYIAYGSIYTTQKGSIESQKEMTENTKKGNNEEYLKNIQKQVPYMKLQIGNDVNTKNDGKIDVLDINPKLLEKMQNDPTAAKEYGQRIKDVENAHKFVDGYLKSTGSTIICSHAYIDENGNYCNFTVSVHKDTFNEKLRKEAEENAKKQIEKNREKLRLNAEELKLMNDDKESAFSVEKMIDKKIEESKDGSVFFNEKEMMQVVQKAKEERGQKETGTYLDIEI